MAVKFTYDVHSFSPTLGFLSLGSVTFLRVCGGRSSGHAESKSRAMTILAHHMERTKGRSHVQYAEGGAIFLRALR